MPRLVAILVIIVLGTCVLGLARPAQAAPTRFELRLINKINQVRANHGLRKLTIGTRLQRGAHSWAGYLRRSDAFYHAGLAAGTGENLAWGTCSWITPAAVVNMWLRSYAHRAVLLRAGFRYVGTGSDAGGWRSYRCARISVARLR